MADGGKEGIGQSPQKIHASHALQTVGKRGKHLSAYFLY